MSVFPATRLRRLRRTGALRELVRETQLDLTDFVMPLFACPGEGDVRPLEGLPGIAQRSLDELEREVEECVRGHAEHRGGGFGSQPDADDRRSGSERLLDRTGLRADDARHRSRHADELDAAVRRLAVDEGRRLRRNRLDPRARDVLSERRRRPPLLHGVDRVFLGAQDGRSVQDCVRRGA